MHVIDKKNENRYLKSIDQFFKKLKNFNLKIYYKFLSRVHNIIYSRESKAQIFTLYKDEIIENYLRFIRHMKIYFLLRYTIKYNDIDIFR